MASSTTSTVAHRVLITAASGKIGQQLVPLLQAQPTPHQLFLLTSDASKLKKSLPDVSRITMCEGSIKDIAWIEKVIQEHRMDTLFICLTGEDELFLSANLISAAQRTGCIKHVIYLSAAGDFASIEALKSRKLDGVMAGNVLAKIPIEQLLHYGVPAPGTSSGAFSWTILGPSLFNENDLGMREAIENGIYPSPMGSIGCSRVSTSDISLGVLRAIEDAGAKWHGKKIMIGTQKLYSDTATSELWSKVMQREVICSSDTDSLQRLEDTMTGALDSSWGRVMRLMFEGFIASGFGMTEDEYATQVTFLGQEPKQYENFVATIGEKWRSSYT